jgi:hypothetical protein
MRVPHTTAPAVQPLVRDLHSVLVEAIEDVSVQVRMDLGDHMRVTDLHKIVPLSC